MLDAERLEEEKKKKGKKKENRRKGDEEEDKELTSNSNLPPLPFPLRSPPKKKEGT